MTRCLIYARFSPRPDGATSDANDRQIELCRKYALKKGYGVAGEYQDRNASRNDLDREGLMDAIFELKRGWVLVCYDESRFGSGHVAHVLEHEVMKRGASLEFVTGHPMDPDDPFAMMIRSIMFAYAEVQRRMIGARTRARMRHHMAQGRKMSGIATYGYRFDDKRMIEDAGEQEIIAAIMDLHAKGRSLHGIAQKLNEDGVPCRGDRWHRMTVWRIVKRETETAQV